LRRLVRGDITVTLRPSGNAPASFVWERRPYEVQKVLLVWEIGAAWWDGEGERTCFRDTATAGRAVALFCAYCGGETGEKKRPRRGSNARHAA
jgi:hypothetical protein